MGTMLILVGRGLDSKYVRTMSTIVMRKSLVFWITAQNEKAVGTIPPESPISMAALALLQGTSRLNSLAPSYALSCIHNLLPPVQQRQKKSMEK